MVTAFADWLAVEVVNASAPFTPAEVAQLAQCWRTAQQATRADRVYSDAATLLAELARICNTQSGQLLKDAARDAARVAARLRQAASEA